MHSPMPLGPSLLCNLPACVRHLQRVEEASKNVDHNNITQTGLYYNSITQTGLLVLSADLLLLHIELCHAIQELLFCSGKFAIHESRVWRVSPATFMELVGQWHLGLHLGPTRAPNWCKHGTRLVFSLLPVVSPCGRVGHVILALQHSPTSFDVSSLLDSERNEGFTTGKLF